MNSYKAASSSFMWTLNSSILHSSVLNGDKMKVCQILNEKQVDIDTLDRWNRTPLFHAVLINNQDILEILLKANARVDISDIHHRSLLHFAADKGQYGCLKIILQAYDKIYSMKDVEGCSLTYPCSDIFGVHPYHVASKLHSSKCLQLLLKYALGSIDLQDNKKRTALHWAVTHGAEENVHLLLKYGADASLADEDGKLPLHHAASSIEEGTKGCLHTLLGTLPSNINKQDRNGATALHLAVMTDQKEKIDLLLASKRGLINATDEEQRTPLHYACNRGLVSITNSLISAGAFIYKKDMYGATPLHYAVLHNHVDVIKLMLTQQEFKDLATGEGETSLHWAAYVGANTALIHLKSHLGSLARKDKSGKTPLHVAAQKNNGSTRTIDVLLQMEASVCDQANDGCTPLHYASREGNLKIVKQLLNADKSSIYIEDKTGRNAMHYSVMGGHLHLTQIFIETGIPIGCSDVYGRNCLHLAAYLGYADVICLLVEHKANVNEGDNEAKTPLHCATVEGHLNAVTALLDANADPNIIDISKERFTPLDYAIKTNKKDVIQVLESAGAQTSQWVAALCIQRNWRSYFRKKCLRRNLRMTKKDDCIYSGEETRAFESFEGHRFPNQANVTACLIEPSVLHPLLTPYFSHEIIESREEDNQDKFSRFEYKGNCVVQNDTSGVRVRLAEGEEAFVARKAFRNRLTGLVLTKKAAD